LGSAEIIRVKKITGLLVPEGVSPSPCPTHIKIFLDRVSRFLKVFLIFQEVSLYPNVGAIMGEGAPGSVTKFLNSQSARQI
jgi:hypothetical protein